MEKWCPFCKDRTIWQPPSAKASKNGVLQCGICGLASTGGNELPSDSLGEDFDQWTKEKLWEVQSGRRSLLRDIAQLVLQRKSEGKLLDVGCSVGTFFENFLSTSWQLFGVDPSQYAGEFARRRFNATVQVGTLDETDLPSDFFDAVTILDTLYYMNDPAQELAEAGRVLKSNGLLIVEIANLKYSLFRGQSLLSFLLDRKSTRFKYDARHLYIFPTPAVVSYLLSIGLSIAAIVPLGTPLRRGFVGSQVGQVSAQAMICANRMSQGYIDLAPKVAILATKVPPPVHYRANEETASQIVIREADITDINKVVQICNECFSKGIAHDHPRILESSYAFNLAKQVLLAVAVMDNEMIGSAEARFPNAAVYASETGSVSEKTKLAARYILSGTWKDDVVKRLFLRPFQKETSPLLEIRA
ncbi:MAG: class I SAM-dependent methyltransferase, partial [Candidatus Marsarchaeota archaeon]|nr:class I SAM-dependent methyltransferase [Candidatus Marsarchaeota archaeon]